MASAGYLFTFPRPLTQARFIERPHRFATRCRLDDGTEVVSHLADPGRLRDVLFPGARLWLQGPFGPPRKLAWSTVGAQVGDQFVCLNSQMPNRLFPALLAGGLFPSLHGEVRAEVTHEDSRFDFQVGDTLVEVKGVTLHLGDGLGAFPDAPSTRAQKHVAGLTRYARAGGQAAVVFIGGHSAIREVTAARHIDPAFAELLQAAGDAGVAISAAGVVWDAHGARDPYPVTVDLTRQLT